MQPTAQESPTSRGAPARTRHSVCAAQGHAQDVHFGENLGRQIRRGAPGEPQMRHPKPPTTTHHP